MESVLGIFVAVMLGAIGLIAMSFIGIYAVNHLLPIWGLTLIPYNIDTVTAFAILITLFGRG